MITTLLFAFPITVLTVILIFIATTFIQRKISYSLLSGALHKNSQKLNDFYGLGFYIFLMASLLPSLFYIIFFKIKVNTLLVGFLIILIPILKKTIDNKSLLLSLLVHLMISFTIIKLLNFKTETIVDISIIGFFLVLILLLNYLFTKLIISEVKLVFLNAIFTFSVCTLAIVIRDQTLFFINLTVFTSSSCFLLHNKLNKKHKILLTQTGQVVIGFFFISSLMYMLKFFFYI
jgi:hypothetical protein